MPSITCLEPSLSNATHLLCKLDGFGTIPPGLILGTAPTPQLHYMRLPACGGHPKPPGKCRGLDLLGTSAGTPMGQPTTLCLPPPNYTMDKDFCWAVHASNERPPYCNLCLFSVPGLGQGTCRATNMTINITSGGKRTMLTTCQGFSILYLQNPRGLTNLSNLEPV